MRTTVTLDDDVQRAVDDLRRQRGLRTSEAVNELARRGLAVTSADRTVFAQTVSSMGEPRISLDDIGAVLDFLEGDARRA